MATPADSDPSQAWQVVHKPTGHKYLMYTVPSREIAQTINWKRKRLSTLLYDYQHAKSPEERAAKRSEFDSENKHLEWIMVEFLQDCLGLTMDQIKAIGTQECVEIFVEVIDYCEKNGPSERIA
ncbi:hypothetical protein Ngar_c13530 [Candidatus Nitrososphaera gargensis Ga9.2]|uniref:Uncharacterized protein n=1 Tax=Nitrososphaera gargensis (strain Ga9.2) TaxID=1237085 RepID=K0IAF1_NITGG|nr:hypothetical protein [Candidatus Nitrososphaera gargensis]AFU58291.1 hypothetical protein Ngar_c13530 [Candidatus Nitrososphaera gargensis Ga9.2]